MPKSRLTGVVIYTLICVFSIAMLVQTAGASVMNAWTYGGPNSDYAYGIIATPDGGHLMVGSTVPNAGDYSDVWLIKVDAHGTALWNKTYGGQFNDVGCNIAQSADGNYIIVGYTCVTNASGDSEFSDGFLLKVDSNGNQIWYKTYGALASSEYTTVLAQTQDGGYAIAGCTYPNLYGAQYGWLVKADSNGNMQWNRTYAKSGMDCFWGIIANHDGGLTLTGGSNGDLWLLKVDSEGQEQWSKTFGGVGNDQGWWILNDQEGGYTVSGATASHGSGGDDAWLLKFDSNGVLQWNQTYGGAADDTAFVLTQTSDGGYAFVGSTCSYGAGDNDFWLVKTDSNGVLQWNQTYGGSGYDVGQCLTVNSLGIYAVAGTTASFGAGGSDGCLIITEAPQTEPAATSSTNLNGVLHSPSTTAIAVVIALLLLAVAVVVLVKKQK